MELVEGRSLVEAARALRYRKSGTDAQSALAVHSSMSEAQDRANRD